MRLTILALFAILVALPARADAVASDDFDAELETSAITLQGWYNNHGLWDTTGWWNAANCVEAIEDAIEANNGRRYVDVLNKTFDLNCKSNFLNQYYDDEGWWALAWIRAYDQTGQERFLQMAKTIFADMTGGWSDGCGGGIWWNKSRRYKNAIANELFLLVAIRLHQRAPNDAGANSYMDWSAREWTWFKNSGMINSQSLVNDGLNRDCENNRRTTWSYNQGVILGALAELYHSTGDTNYIGQARDIADAAIHTLVDEGGILRDRCETTGCRGGDSPQFKGIFIRNLKCLNDTAPKQDYTDFLLRNARAVWLNDRDSTNHLGLRWAGPFDRADAARHSSAMAAIGAVAEPQLDGTSASAKLPAAIMEHGIGRICGVNAWSADPASDHASGILASRRSDDPLPSGKAAAVFWLKVDNFSLDKNIVATVSVVESPSGKTIASKDIRRNEFPNTLYTSFELGFKATSGRHYSFQTLWHYFPDAPRVTELGIAVEAKIQK